LQERANDCSFSREIAVFLKRPCAQNGIRFCALTTAQGLPRVPILAARYGTEDRHRGPRCRGWPQRPPPPATAASKAAKSAGGPRWSRRPFVTPNRQPRGLLLQQHSAGRCQTVADLEGPVPTLPASSFCAVSPASPGSPLRLQDRRCGARRRGWSKRSQPCPPRSPAGPQRAQAGRGAGSRRV
jgi:hypothetical protein